MSVLCVVAEERITSEKFVSQLYVTDLTQNTEYSCLAASRAGHHSGTTNVTVITPGDAFYRSSSVFQINIHSSVVCVQSVTTVTTVPLSVSYGGAKPLGPCLGPLTSFPGV